MRKIVHLSFIVISICLISVQNPYARPVAEYTGIITVAAQNRNSISGFVFGESRTPVSTVYVELTNEFNSTISRIQTRGSGMFSFTGLPSGLYNVKVLTGGTDYEEQTRSVSLVPISVIQDRGSISEQVDFYLRLKKKRNVGPLAAPGVLFVQEIPDSAKKLYESGIVDLADKKEIEGFNKLKRSLEISPDYFMALDRLGTEYIVRGYYLPAFVLLTKAVEVNPRSFSSTFGLGLAEFRLNQPDKAVKSFKNAVQLSSDSINAHLWLGVALHSKNNLPEALASMLHANKLSKGNSAEVHWQLARVYKDQKLFRQAADELEIYLKFRPNAENVEEIKQIVSSLRQKQ